MITASAAPIFLCAMGVAAYAETERHESVMPGTIYETDQWTKAGELPGPVVMVIGGCHGNEIAGYMAANELRRWTITRGTLVLIPEAHKEAIRRNVRAYPGNMNMMFPGDPNGDDMHRLASAIWSKIKAAKPGLLVTLHESLGFHAENHESYGQTLTHDFSIINPMMDRAIARTNADIPEGRDRFRIYIYPLETCPTYTAWEFLDLPATSIETSMELPLGHRIRYQLMMLMGFFDEVGLGYEPVGLPRLSTAAKPPGTNLGTYVDDLLGRAHRTARSPQDSGRKPPTKPTPVPKATALPAPPPSADPGPANTVWKALLAGGCGAVLIGGALIMLDQRRARPLL
ncbi:MAG: succinylglutamate desuccinylase/aspartoacylase family protein [Armatimonadetes bacterium]|nr:succinylglutamate desuccinylase/aspartoacylase family protein [Armatimonadota bacterium]